MVPSHVFSKTWSTSISMAQPNFPSLIFKDFIQALGETVLCLPLSYVAGAFFRVISRFSVPLPYFFLCLCEMYMYYCSRIDSCSIKQFWNFAHFLNINQVQSHANPTNSVKGIFKDIISKIGVTITMGVHTSCCLDPCKPSIHNKSSPEGHT